MSDPNGTGGRFDLASLAKSAAPAEIRTASARAGESNPFLDSVRKSHELDRKERDSGWMAVEVPSRMLDELVTTMRALSTWFGEVGEKIGVHFRVEFQPDPENTPDEWIEVGPGRFEEIPRDDRTIAFKYTGRDRMKRGRRRPTAQQPAAGLVDQHADEVEDDELQPA